MKSFLYSILSSLIEKALSNFRLKYERKFREANVVMKDLETCTESDRLYIILIRDLDVLVGELRELSDEMIRCEVLKVQIAKKLGM